VAPTQGNFGTTHTHAEESDCRRRKDGERGRNIEEDCNKRCRRNTLQDEILQRSLPNSNDGLEYDRQHRRFQSEEQSRDRSDSAKQSVDVTLGR
jgi:hypothetical protein